ncbi:hypothetical protein RF11_12690 [Thelohanellus kitauei]|uniref:Uncharacterized protein n=1 Tax=Thelohanellus kitauei TaxID=669202 RepID=A0A0C2MYH3_THEKT|nr:hypothetical protein RF11_12690 [Thelohanellus kitauei]
MYHLGVLARCPSLFGIVIAEQFRPVEFGFSLVMDRSRIVYDIIATPRTHPFESPDAVIESFWSPSALAGSAPGQQREIYGSGYLSASEESWRVSNYPEGKMSIKIRIVCDYSNHRKLTNQSHIDLRRGFQDEPTCWRLAITWIVKSGSG